jgi:hypothetical protein
VFGGKNALPIVLIFGLGFTYAQNCLASSSHDKPTFYSAADTGFGFVDEDGFVLIFVEQGFKWEGLEINLSGPFRLRVIDRSPTDDGVLREQDWDEASDFMRILRTVSFVREWNEWAIEFQLGEQNNLKIGHGALVDAYFNSTQIDMYQGGVFLKGSWTGNGLEFMMNNVIVPEILLGRVFVAPLSWFLKGKWATRLEIGYTLGADISAPYRTQGTGKTSIPVTGGDISFRVIDKKWLVLTPYTELMAMDGDLGVHIGLTGSFEASESKGIYLHLRGEYRYVGPDYHPAVFNPFYEYNKWYYDLGAPGQIPTFADHLANPDDLPARHGGMVEAALEWTDGLRFGARYDTEGINRRHWVMFRLDVFPWHGYGLSAFYAGQDLLGGTDLFSYDSLIGISARGRIWGPLSLFAEFTRRWRHIKDSPRMANEIGGGIGVSISY